MTKIEYQGLAYSLFRQHGLHDWTFQWDKAKRRLGCCKQGKKIISLSGVLVEHYTVSEITDTILHEIAHALVGPQHGHGYIWRKKAREIGCTAQRCCRAASVNGAPIEKTFIGNCPNCQHKVARYRRARAACVHCCRKFNGGKFDPQYILQWSRN